MRVNRRTFLNSALGIAALAGIGGYVSFHFLKKRDISLWGHSFFGNNDVFSNRMIRDTGANVYNFGLSGSTSVSIALRNGAYRIRYSPIDGELKKDVKTPLLPNVPGPLSAWANSDISWFHLPCALDGIDGLLDWDGKEVTFTGRRDRVGVSETDLLVYPMTTVATANVRAGVLFSEHPGSIYLLWLGRNNSSDPDQILKDAKAIVARMDKGNDRFVILPEFPSDNEVNGSKEAEQIVLINKIYQDEFPGHYCEIDGVDLLQNFKNHLNPDNPDDVQDVKNGLTPRSLREDGLHPSITKKPNALYIGAEVNAEFVSKYLKMKEWV